MTKFCNPYHFVPVEKTHFVPVEKTEEQDLKNSLKVTDVFDENARSQRHKKLKNYSHAQYYPETFSGRVICRLTTEGAVFIGATQERPDPNDVAVAHPFELEQGIPAIPASSLRGLLSSLAEAASNSALRVLDDRTLSYRQKVEEALSAIGMVVCQEDESGQQVYRLRPLTVPTLKKLEKDKYGYNPSEKQVYKLLFPDGAVPLRVYLSCEDSFLKNKTTFYFPRSYFEKIPPEPPFDKGGLGGISKTQRVTADSLNETQPEFYYAKLHDDRFVIHHPNRLRRSKKDSIVIGQKIIDNSPILTSKEWEALPSSSKKEHYTRGILRILGKKGRRDMAGIKKYELFIPYSEKTEKIPWEELPRILPQAIERFEQLADERTEATEEKEQGLNILPYHLLGTSRNLSNDPKDQRLRLKTGDLVYFKPELDKNNTVVITEVSFSSVWRARVEMQNRENASVYDFFAKIDPELLPFNAGRNYISPAELLFGFVQKETAKTSPDATKQAGSSLSGRVQVSFGLLDPHQPKPYYQPEVILKSLLSPKPPCPIMYFKGQRVQKPITKSSLTPDQHIPQGRKMYLHHPRDNREQPRETLAPEENKQLKTKICPLHSGTVFYFHLDFYNLTRWELGLLCYALRPNDAFRHKLGMGKPIGLGTVRIDPLGLFLIDREKRYRTQDIFNSPRYHQMWVNTQIEIPPGYPQEYQATQYLTECAPHWEILRNEFAKTMSPHIRNALELLGDPSKIHATVHVPKEGTVEVDNPEIENENFEWFKENYGKQQLAPLNKESTEIPMLERLSQQQKPLNKKF